MTQIEEMAKKAGIPVNDLIKDVKQLLKQKKGGPRKSKQPPCVKIELDQSQRKLVHAKVVICIDKVYMKGRPPNWRHLAKAELMSKIQGCEQLTVVDIEIME